MRSVSDVLTFASDRAKHSPAFRRKRWDGRVRMMNRGGKVPRGLHSRVIEACAKLGFGVDDRVGRFVAGVDSATTAKIVSRYATPFPPKAFQLEAIRWLLDRGRGVVMSPTGSGKSFIIYLTIRIMADLHKDGKVMLVVPNKGLIDQMRKDFHEYAAIDPGFDVEGACHFIFQGQPKATTKRIIVTTWQSIYELPRSWFAPIKCVIGDECHLFAAKSLTAIMANCENAHHRLGLTGSLTGEKIHRMQLEGSFGDVHVVATTADLIKSKDLTRCIVRPLILRYPKWARNELPSRYQDEIKYIVGFPARIKFQSDFLGTLKGNTMILFQFLDLHGKPLYDLVKRTYGESRCFYVDGSVDGVERSDIRERMESMTDAIAVASYGTFSTGINIRNLHNLIMASPFKARVKAVQSPGRALRVAQGKDIANIYDVVDECGSAKPNYAMKHFAERLKIYESEGHPVQPIVYDWDGPAGGPSGHWKVQ